MLDVTTNMLMFDNHISIISLVVVASVDDIFSTLYFQRDSGR